MKLDPRVYLAAAGEIADGPNIGCCGVIDYVCRDPAEYALRGPTPEEAVKAGAHKQAFAEWFAPEWGTYRCYWWAPHGYDTEAREARVIALLLMYHLTKEGQ